MLTLHQIKFENNTNICFIEEFNTTSMHVKVCTVTRGEQFMLQIDTIHYYYSQYQPYQFTLTIFYIKK